MVVLLYEKATDGDQFLFDDPLGLLVDTYRVGSNDFVQMAKAVYNPSINGIVEVYEEEIGKASGSIFLKEKKGKLCLDWSKFNPYTMPINRSGDYSNELYDEIEANYKGQERNGDMKVA